MTAEYDFIVVGSGAGGGPLACRLAQDPAGYSVALIEAGSDPAKRSDGRENFNYSVPVLHARATEDIDLSWDFFVDHYSEEHRQKADSKYVPDNSPDPDGHGDPRRRGIFYPRAGTWGGCTSHNAMITMYPHNEDWENIRQLTGDPTWAPDVMRSYFERLENCRYAPLNNPEGRHGFGNWLSTSLLGLDVLKAALHEQQIVDLVLGAVKAHIQALLQVPDGTRRESLLFRLINRSKTLLQVVKPTESALNLRQLSAITTVQDALLDPEQVVQHLATKLRTVAEVNPEQAADRLIDELRQQLFQGLDIKELLEILVWRVDPNDWRVVQEGLVGLFAIPLATDGARRSGPREWIQATIDNCPYRLEVLSGRLVTKIVFDGNRAVGVKVTSVPHSYTASRRNPNRKGESLPAIGAEVEFRARREIILAGGAFNTPQVLMLSGIGPKEVLDTHQIPPLLGRYWPGVGRNLQDRYEVAIVSEMQDNFQILRDCTFAEPEDLSNPGSCFREWWKNRGGVYTTNGALFGIVLRSSVAEHVLPPGSPGISADPPPDLFLFSLLGRFKGYLPGYSDQTLTNKNILTWAVLKGHTRNQTGDVTLRSTDPRELPRINFRYFNDGQLDQGAEKDLDALIEGIDHVRRALAGTKSVKRLLFPEFPLENLHEPAVRDQLRKFIMDETWGHHACGTCKIGRDSLGSEAAVVNSEFQVHGLQGLRIVDASVFPKIPGFFIVTPIYMIAEKAAENILRDASQR